MHNKHRRSINPYLLSLVLLMPLLTAGEAYSTTEKQNSETESDDQARPTAPERKAQSSGPITETRVFVPTEKISADKEISFPTDI